MNRKLALLIASLTSSIAYGQTQCPAGAVIQDDTTASFHADAMITKEELEEMKAEREQEALDFKAIKSDEIFRLDFDKLTNGFFQEASARPITVSFTGNASQSVTQGIVGDGITKTPSSGKLTASPVPIQLNDANGSSLSAWFKTSATNSMTLLDNRTAATNGVGISLNYHSNGIMMTVACGASGARNYLAPSTTSLVDNRWQHVAVNIANTATIFINGEPSPVFDLSWCAASLTGSNTLNIGENNFWAHWAFNGAIDDVRVNNSVYTQDQILDQSSVSRFAARTIPGSTVTVTPDYCSVDVEYAIPNAYSHYEKYLICLKKSTTTVFNINEEVCSAFDKVEITYPNSAGLSDHTISGLDDGTTYLLAIAGVTEECTTTSNSTTATCTEKREEINELKTSFTTKKSIYTNSISVENVTTNKATVKWTQECGASTIGLCVKKKGFWRDIGECNSSNRTFIDINTSDPNLVLLDGVNSGKYTFTGLKAKTTYYAKGWLENTRGYENRLSDSLRWPKFKTKSASSTFKVDVSKSSNSITLTWKTDQQFENYKVCHKPAWSFDDTCNNDYVNIPGNVNPSGVITYTHTIGGLKKNKKYKVKIYGESAGAKPVKLWRDKVKTNKR